MPRLRLIGMESGITAEIELFEDKSPKTVKALLQKLPIEGEALWWGGEIHVDVHLDVESESPTEVLQVGDIAYWPEGGMLCLFLGPTPASFNNEIRAAAPVNVFGHVVGDASSLKKLKHGEKIRLELVEETN